MHELYLTKRTCIECTQGHSSINKGVSESGDLKRAEMGTVTRRGHFV